MKYISSSEVRDKKINYEGIDTRIPWVYTDGCFDYFNQKYINFVPENILDIGCGNGFILEQYKNTKTTLLGIDLNNYLDQKVASLVEFSSVDVNFEPLPYKDNSVDLVFAFQVLEHLENPVYVAREVKRVLKTNQYFVMSIPNAFTLTSRLRFLLSGNLTRWRKDNDHLFFYTRDVFEKLFLNDFELLEIRYERGIPPLLGRFLGWMRIPFNKEKLKFMPRSIWFAKSTMYILKKR